MTDKKDRLLIVESDSAVSANISEFLDNFGYSSDVVCDTDQIADKMQSKQYELVLMDQHYLSDKKFPVFHAIRSFDHTVDIVIMFNDPTVEILLELSRSGVTKFIIKPFTSKEINDTVAKGIHCTKRNREYEIFSDNKDEIVSLPKKTNKDVCSTNESTKV